jgi:uncharacterized protein YbaR (Trm112 family)
VNIDPMLLEVIVCPDCKGALEVREAEEELRCVACGLIYSTADGFPALLVDEARRSE